MTRRRWSARLSKRSSWSRFAAFFQRWFRVPAMLERLLARRLECGSAAARFRTPRPDRKPALLALEDREAPQLMVPMAAAVGGAIIASQVLARQAQASTTE